MTDLEKFKELLTSVGVDNFLIDENNVLTLIAKETNKVEGYYDFFTEIHFTEDGKFDYIGIYE